MSSIDELEDFAMGTMRRSASASDTATKYREAGDAGTKKKEFGVDDLDSFFSAGPRSSSVPKSRTTTEVRMAFEILPSSVYYNKENVFYMCILFFLSDAKTIRKQAFNVPKKTPNGSAKKPPAPANLVDDFSALFGGICCENMSFPAIGYVGGSF